MKKILKSYKKPGALKYGLKISSPFIEDFSSVVAGGGEVVFIGKNTHKTMKNDLSLHRLILVTIEEGGTFEYEERVSGTAHAKSDLHIFLKGKGARAEIKARYEVNGDSKIDILHKVYHEADETVSKIETRGVLSGESHAIYRSDINMKKGLRALEGNESAKFLLLSKTAKIDAIPALDIASREVKSNHSLSISRIGEEEMFYTKSRGLEDREAKELILEGFLI